MALGPEEKVHQITLATRRSFRAAKNVISRYNNATLRCISYVFFHTVMRETSDSYIRSWYSKHACLNCGVGRWIGLITTADFARRHCFPSRLVGYQVRRTTFSLAVSSSSTGVLGTKDVWHEVQQLASGAAEACGLTYPAEYLYHNTAVSKRR